MRQLSGQSGSDERPQSFDPAQDFPEQPSRHDHFGQLERDVAGVANDPGGVPVGMFPASYSYSATAVEAVTLTNRFQSP
jgi:hypothetical protein